MKFKLIFFIIFLTAINSYSQTTLKYDTCSYIKKFEGNWMYANGDDTIRVSLRYARVCYPNMNFINDFIFGWHEYKKGNIIVESNYQNRNVPILYYDTLSTNTFSIRLSNSSLDCNFLNKKASGAIIDYNQAKELHIVDIQLNPLGNEITWKQSFAEFHGMISHAYGMTLPKQFKLKKQ